MKRRSFAGSLATLFLASASVLASGLIPTHQNVVRANTRINFACEQNSTGTWTTFAVYQDGTRNEFIKWRSDDFTLAGYPPRTRCQQVTNRMNRYRSRGSGQHVTHGIINNLPVLCITSGKGKGCEELLYTLKQDQDPEATLRDLFELSRRHFNGDPLIESKSCRTYVNINAALSGELVRASVACNAQ